jgi:hypothetical protein
VACMPTPDAYGPWVNSSWCSRRVVWSGGDDLLLTSPGAEPVCRSKTAGFAISAVLQDPTGLLNRRSIVRLWSRMRWSRGIWFAVWKILYFMVFFI